LNYRSIITIVLIVLIVPVIFLSGCGGSSSSNSSPSTSSAPKPPTDVATFVGEGQVDIFWTALPDASSYNVYRSSFSNMSGATKLAGITVSSYVDTNGLATGTTYWYVITAVNTAGESATSTAVAASIPILAAPQAVSAVSGAGKVTLYWRPAGFATSYNIYRSLISGTKGTLLATTTEHSYVDATPVNGTPYYYVIASVNAKGESGLSTEVTATPSSAGAPVSVTVSGKIQYEDKEYDENGFTGKTSFKAARFVSVDIVNAASPAAPLTTGVTDANGAYSVSLDAAELSLSVYIRVNSTAKPVNSPAIEVKSLSPVALYGVVGSTFIPSGDVNVNINIPVTNSAAGAFNILDVYTSGFEFIHYLSGTYPPALTAYWMIGNSNGTFFCTDASGCFPGAPGAGIYVLNYGGDSDEFDDDVLWHEFGHFTAANYSHDDSPGGMHYLSSNDLDLRLSWSEGWGDFFPGAVKYWLNSSPDTRVRLSSSLTMPISQYVDTTGKQAGISINIDQPYQGTNSANDPYIHASSEIAVAKVLWNLMTGTGNFGMPSVWNVVTDSAYKNLPYPNLSSNQANLELFWDAWLKRPTAVAEMGTLQSVLTERRINYAMDSFEPDAGPVSSRRLVVGQSEEHTLYAANDADYVAFDVAAASQPYTIKTMNLLDGADTVISIYSSSDLNKAIASNDNADGWVYDPVNVPVPGYCDSNGICHDNGFDILGSQITYVFSVPGTYYVKVMSSQNRPLSAGRYGSYTLSITSP